nr:PREDICTED: amelogenin, X isoform [Latimeria chalumnae]|eukprot:XP_005998289.1 PREDICTED: amelogenin, X isoform [Latimeria chalumnae]
MKSLSLITCFLGAALALPLGPHRQNPGTANVVNYSYEMMSPHWADWIRQQSQQYPVIEIEVKPRPPMSPQFPISPMQPQQPMPPQYPMQPMQPQYSMQPQFPVQPQFAVQPPAPQQPVAPVEPIFPWIQGMQQQQQPTKKTEKEQD